MAAALEISLLGPPRVARDGRPVSFDTRKATALLAHLALSGGPRPREALCELLWPGQDPEHARAALRRTLSAVRKAIDADWIDAATDRVALREAAGLAVDVRRFRELAADGAGTEDLAAAAELFRGELLEGFGLRDSPEFDAWCALEGGALQRELGGVLGRLAGRLAERGEYARAIPYARRRVALDPLQEPGHRALIRLYALDGDRAAAIAQYRECVRTLAHELGVAPVEETAVLFEQVSAGTLTAPPPPARRPGGRDTAPRAPGALPLTGRDSELAALRAAHLAAGEDGRLAVVEGEAGIGKTRIVGELLAEAQSAGAVVLSARCHDDEADVPYGPVVELLRAALAAPALGEAVSPQRRADASLLLPELAAEPGAGPAPVPLTAPGARARLLEGVGSVLAVAGTGARPGIVFVDDVHAADDATLDVLAYLARRLRGRPLLLLLAWRTEAVPAGHRLRRLAAGLAREGTGIVVLLDRLDEEAVTAIVGLAAPGAAPGLAQRVHAESEGLPLFVAEYLAAAVAGVEPADGVPRGEMRDLLEARLAGLGATALQLLETAAVIGRSFDLETLRVASGRGDEETADGLEALIASGVVRELPAAEPAYDFTHGKLRTLVYATVGLARRRLLHRRVAEAVLRSAPGAGSASLAAQHLRLAGDHRGAAAQHRRAAEHAASLLAHGDALAHLDAALALGSPDTAELHERLGDLRTLVGDYAAARSSYETAAAELDGAALARVEHKLGGVHRRRGEWDRAEARFGVALEAAGDAEPGLRARILADLSLTARDAGDEPRAAVLAGKARTLAESAADERAQTQAHNLLGVLARGRRDSGAARAELERSLVLAERLGDPSARAAALNNLALVARDAGEPGRALELTEAALAACVAGGDRHREAALENNLADLHHAAGRTAEAMAHLKRAVALFSEVGADERTRLPEIWKLVSW